MINMKRRMHAYRSDPSVRRPDERKTWGRSVLTSAPSIRGAWRSLGLGAHMQVDLPRAGYVYIYIYVHHMVYVTNVILRGPRRRATCGGASSPSPELCCSRRKGVTRSGRAAHRSPHYLGEALLNIQNAPNAEEARHAHVQRMPTTRCGRICAGWSGKPRRRGRARTRNARGSATVICHRACGGGLYWTDRNRGSFRGISSKKKKKKSFFWQLEEDNNSRSSSEGKCSFRRGAFLCSCPKITSSQANISSGL